MSMLKLKNIIENEFDNCEIIYSFYDCDEYGADEYITIKNDYGFVQLRSEPQHILFTINQNGNEIIGEISGHFLSTPEKYSERIITFLQAVFNILKNTDIKLYKKYVEYKCPYFDDVLHREIDADKLYENYFVVKYITEKKITKRIEKLNRDPRFEKYGITLHSLYEIKPGIFLVGASSEVGNLCDTIIINLTNKEYYSAVKDVDVLWKNEGDMLLRSERLGKENA